MALLLSLLPISDGDIDAAKGMWEQYAPRAYAGLLSTDPKHGRYDFDPQRQLYIRRSTDRPLGGDELKRISIGFAQGVGRDAIEPDALKVAQDAIPVDQWAQRTASDLKDAAIVMAAMAVGGFDNLTDAAKQQIIGTADAAPGLAFNLTRLAGFAADIEDRAPRANTEAAIVARSGLYAQAINGLWEEMRRTSHEDARDEKGRALFLYERNVLAPISFERHCRTTAAAPGCPELSELGWVSIGTLPAPGLRACGPSCLCSLAFSLTGPIET